jgi:hypothetical protein
MRCLVLSLTSIHELGRFVAIVELLEYLLEGLEFFRASKSILEVFSFALVF